MEVKPGYKQTEVGVIPEDWEIAKLIEQAKVVDSLHQTPSFSDDGYSMVRVSDIKPGNLELNGTLKVCESVFNEFTKSYRPKRGDIVLSRVGSYGISSFVETDAPFCMGQNTVVIEPKVPARFLYYVLNSSNARQQIEDKSFGTGYKSLSLKNIKELKIPLPPTLAEQEAIAEALSDADALIEALAGVIAKKRQIKQGAMQALLCPKDGWLAIKLGSLGAFLKGSGVRKDDSLSGDLPCVRYGEMYTKHKDYIKAFYSWISPTVAATARRLKFGDVLFAGSGETKEEIGKCVAFVDDIEAYAGGDVVILRPDKADSMFLGYYLNTAPINRQKASKGQGDAVVHISSTALAGIDLTLPSLPEQTAIAAILSDMDAEIAALEAKLAKARQVKQGMMQELLTGRIRLVDGVETQDVASVRGSAAV